jgi:hypothetical protein
MLTHVGAGAERTSSCGFDEFFGQQSSFPAAVELDPSRAALKNTEALPRQNDELQIKPADLVSLKVSFF